MKAGLRDLAVLGHEQNCWVHQLQTGWQPQYTEWKECLPKRLDCVKRD